jgi:predicted RNA polymerase sigma factor
MRDYHLLFAVAGDLLCRSGAHEQAREKDRADAT